MSSFFVYAFDVDETLTISNGPVSPEQLERLHNEGHVVGICGNWAGFVQSVPGWQRYINFLGQMEMSKPAFLSQLKVFIPALRYIMVGNDPAIFGNSHDKQAAEMAGWEFIREHDFVEEMRVVNG